VSTTEIASRRIAVLEGELAAARAELAALRAQAAEAARAEREHQDQKERLRAALAGSGAGTFRWDIRSNLLDWDAELDRLFGLPPGVTSRSLAQFLELVHPDDRSGVIARCERCARDGADFEMTFRVIWPDGSVRWLYDRGGVYRDAEGRPAYMTGACIDVTERQEQLAQLRAGEERLRLAQVAGGVGTFEWFPERDEVVGSEQYRRLWGLTPYGPISGAALLEIVHPDDRRLSGPARAADLSSALDYAEFRIRLPDTGEERWLARRGQLVEGGDHGPARLIGVVYDVTERRRVERRLEDVLESVTDGFIAVDSSWRIVLINGAAQRHSGLSREHAVGASYWDALRMHLATPIETALRRVMSSREPLTIETASIRFPGRYMELRIAPTQEGGVALCFTEVTERHEAARHRELLIHELNHRVKNTLAVVQATAHQTLRRSEVSAEVREAFAGRLAALASAHDILTRRNWESALLDELLETALAPFTQRAGERIALSGPKLRLPAKTAVSFALAIHELATNAAKYGALSNEAGRVSVSWLLARRDEMGWLKLRWKETGGPAVVAPARRGFGSRMIEKALAEELAGQVRLKFEPTGVTCAIDSPLHYLDLALERANVPLPPPAA
jgi:PAS domain S-box-containing protein